MLNEAKTLEAEAALQDTRLVKHKLKVIILSMEKCSPNSFQQLAFMCQNYMQHVGREMTFDCAEMCSLWNHLLAYSDVQQSEDL